jgi:hypothetical protein
LLDEPEIKIVSEKMPAEKKEPYDMNNVLKGDGPKPADMDATALEQYAKDKGANSMTAWFLSFSLPNAWAHLCRTRCKLWDNRELDIFEGVKFFSYILGQLSLTSQFTMNNAQINPWMMTTFFTKLAFTVVCSGAIVMETYVFCSGFFGAYKMFQVYDAKGGLTMKDVGKFYLGKYLRLAPMFYFVFLAGWTLFPYMGAGPMWYSAHSMFDDCKDYWWA